VAQEVDRAIQQLLDTGNQTFRGRYLFAGSKITQAPFSLLDGLVQYTGNETALKSYSDIDTLSRASGTVPKRSPPCSPKWPTTACSSWKERTRISASWKRS
jgi:flagellin-like hook-associated protein FlgL